PARFRTGRRLAACAVWCRVSNRPPSRREGRWRASRRLGSSGRVEPLLALPGEPARDGEGWQVEGVRISSIPRHAQRRAVRGYLAESLLAVKRDPTMASRNARMHLIRVISLLC